MPQLKATNLAKSYGGRDVVQDVSLEIESGQVVGLLVGLTLLVVGLAGVFFGKLIKSAVSRQREFLADASAAQFTRMSDKRLSEAAWIRSNACAPSRIIRT